MVKTELKKKGVQKTEFLIRLLHRRIKIAVIASAVYWPNYPYYTSILKN